MILNYLYLKFFYGETLLTSLVVNSLDFSDGSDSKASAYNAGDPGSIPGLERDPLEKGMATHSSILAWRI